MLSCHDKLNCNSMFSLMYTKMAEYSLFFPSDNLFFPVLFFMLWSTYYSQNYASIIRQGLTVGGPGGGMFPPIIMLGGIAPPIINWEHQAQVTNDLYYYSKGVSTPRRRGRACNSRTSCIEGEMLAVTNMTLL